MSVINRVVNKLSQDGSESLACARAPGLTNANGYCKYSGEYKPNHACAREAVRASRAGGRFTEAEVEAWRCDPQGARHLQTGLRQENVKNPKGGFDKNKKN